ncbi:Hint domain-containing protein [uncultured Jannaschia sp.]|uniref:Hint domain-containing protein n=1 Tax=uncultured Jannaschia sp. TaxID=293347 RepID=UPI00263570CE|nr:Hint domain-containing protein [uncultured Jannaschia sp.]
MTTTIDFNSFSAGTIINDQLDGVTVTSGNGHNPPMIFDTAHPTGGDYDLATSNLGKVLILSEDGDSHDPDDEAHGGMLTFDFDGEVDMHSITVLDADEPIWIKLYDEHGNFIRQYDVTTANGGQKVVHLDTAGVGKMVVKFDGSGAVDNIVYDAGQGDGVVNGTAAGELIDTTYVDAQGDRVDANDAIGVAGTTGNEDLILAGGGHDTVYAGEADDIVFGGTGNDKIFGEAGDDTLNGEDGCDTIEGGAGDDLIDGGAHGDALHGGDGADTILGGSGNDQLSGGAGHNVLDGGSGRDTIFGGDDADTIDGGTGDDKIEGRGGADSIEGGAGDDLITGYDATSIKTGDTSVASDDGAADTIDGGAGNDTILGGKGDDVLSGGAGDDVIDGGKDDDLIFGDTGGTKGAPICGARESFNWSHAHGYGDEVARDSLTQDTGEVTVSFTTTKEVGTVRNQFETDDQNVAGIDSGSETINDNSSFGSIIRDDEFAAQYAFDYSGPVCDVSFNINDIDGDGKVTVVAYDADGKPVPVTLTGGSNLTVAGGMASSNGGYQPDSSDDYSVTVDIAGPVSRIEILHEMTGDADSGINITDVFHAPVIGFEDPTGIAGDDLLTGGDGADTIFGEAGDDTIIGGAGQDELFGGDDRDTFISVTPGDVIDGNEGGDDFDTLDLTGVDAIVEFDPDNAENGTIFFTGPDGKPTGETASFVNIENVIGGVVRDGIVEGTEDGDLIDVDYTGDPDGDLVDNDDALLPGEVGDDDIILAGGGNDTILAGDGDDEIDAGDGDDSVEAGIGDDLIEGGAGNDTILGEEGDDTLLGGLGDDSLSGGDGNDSIRGLSGEDTLDGGDGDDTLRSGADGDSVIGGLGNDLITGNGGADTIDAGVIGSPDLGYPGLFPSDDDPNDDRDNVEGRGGDDWISTGDDDDTINGGSGRDTIDGGFDRDLIDGDDGNDFIIGGEGSDTILGGSGNDTIYAGFGPGAPDALNIPDDRDLVQDNGRDVVDGGIGDDLIFGADDDDSLSGGEGNDTLFGEIDEDTLDGGAGDDSLDGGDGDDSIIGGTGNDTIVGGDGLDSLSGGDDRDVFLGGNGGDTVDGGAGGDDFDTLDLTGAGVDRVEYTSADREDGTVFFDDGTTLGFTEIENVVPCFTPGTLIATPRGEVPVESLSVGDRIITRDNGIQVVRWIGSRTMEAAELKTDGTLRPVLIRAGALGHGLPERDMKVSPQHRMLIANDETMLYFDEREVLIAAKHLVGRPGIERAEPEDTTYIHVMFDNHEVILSDGAWTESFQPGDQTLKGLGEPQREEIFAIFPELRGHEGRVAYVAARRMLKRKEAELLVR